MERRGSVLAAVRRRRVRLLAGLAVVAVLAVTAAVALAASQRQTAAELRSRFASRVRLGSGFVTAYTAQLMDHEAAQARVDLSGDTSRFDDVVSAFGFTAAELLDSRGRLLAVVPSAPDLLGTAIAARYPHLRSAEDGRRAVSPVVAGAATGEPVVGFAVPFSTPSGPRVFSGAFTTRRNPLADYLRATASLRSSDAYLVDAGGEVVAAARSEAGTGVPAALSPALEQALRRAPSGTTHGLFYASAPVRATPWRLLLAVPSGVLLGPVSGAAHDLPWLALVLLAVTAAGVVVLTQWLADERARLRVLNERLGDLAHVDALTGILNRRGIAERLERESARCGPLALLMLDVDNFKRVNDTFGHDAGDGVLLEVARRLCACIRDDDAVGRWGGEEFMVVVPGSDGEAAFAVAERVVESLRSCPFPVGTGGDEILVTASIGVASTPEVPTAALVIAADKALYVAKRAGRDQVRRYEPKAHGADARVAGAVGSGTTVP